MGALSGFPEKALKTETLEALSDLLKIEINSLGFRFFEYVALPAGAGLNDERSRAFVLTNYPPEWTEGNLGQSQFLKNLLAIAAATKTFPFTWGSEELEEHAVGQDAVVVDARQHGLARGISIPMRGPRGELAVFTAASGEPEAHFRLAVKAKLAAIYFVAMHLHIVLFDRWVRREESDQPSLSDREMECLDWTARGKTSWEISRILDLSVATVNFHLKNATRKLDATNKCHAVAKAVDARLIGVA